jgi:hypothetical protein
MNKETGTCLISFLSRKFSIVIHVRGTRKHSYSILLRPLKGKEENSEFPIAPMNAFRRGIKRLQKGLPVR